MTSGIPNAGLPAGSVQSVSGPTVTAHVIIVTQVILASVQHMVPMMQVEDVHQTACARSGSSDNAKHCMLALHSILYTARTAW